MGALRETTHAEPEEREERAVVLMPGRDSATAKRRRQRKTPARALRTAERAPAPEAARKEMVQMSAFAVAMDDDSGAEGLPAARPRAHAGAAGAATGIDSESASLRSTSPPPKRARGAKVRQKTPLAARRRGRVQQQHVSREQRELLSESSAAASIDMDVDMEDATGGRGVRVRTETSADVPAPDGVSAWTDAHALSSVAAAVAAEATAAAAADAERERLFDGARDAGVDTEMGDGQSTVATNQAVGARSVSGLSMSDAELSLRQATDLLHSLARGDTRLQKSHVSGAVATRVAAAAAAAAGVPFDAAAAAAAALQNRGDARVEPDNGTPPGTVRIALKNEAIKVVVRNMGTRITPETMHYAAAWSCSRGKYWMTSGRSYQLLMQLATYSVDVTASPLFRLSRFGNGFLRAWEYRDGQIVPVRADAVTRPGELTFSAADDETFRTKRGRLYGYDVVTYLGGVVHDLRARVAPMAALLEAELLTLGDYPPYVQVLFIADRVCSAWDHRVGATGQIWSSVEHVLRDGALFRGRLPIPTYDPCSNGSIEFRGMVTVIRREPNYLVPALWELGYRSAFVPYVDAIMGRVVPRDGAPAPSVSISTHPITVKTVAEFCGRFDEIRYLKAAGVKYLSLHTLRGVPLSAYDLPGVSPTLVQLEALFAVGSAPTSIEAAMRHPEKCVQTLSLSSMLATLARLASPDARAAAGGGGSARAPSAGADMLLTVEGTPGALLVPTLVDVPLRHDEATAQLQEILFEAVRATMTVPAALAAITDACTAIKDAAAAEPVARNGTVPEHDVAHGIAHRLATWRDKCMLLPPGAAGTRLTPQEIYARVVPATDWERIPESSHEWQSALKLLTLGGHANFQAVPGTQPYLRTFIETTRAELAHMGAAAAAFRAAQAAEARRQGAKAAAMRLDLLPVAPTGAATATGQEATPWGSAQFGGTTGAGDADGAPRTASVRFGMVTADTDKPPRRRGRPVGTSKEAIARKRAEEAARLLQISIANSARASGPEHAADAALGAEATEAVRQADAQAREEAAAAAAAANPLDIGAPAERIVQGMDTTLVHQRVFDFLMVQGGVAARDSPNMQQALMCLATRVILTAIPTLNFIKHADKNECLYIKNASTRVFFSVAQDGAMRKYSVRALGAYLHACVTNQITDALVYKSKTVVRVGQFMRICPVAPDGAVCMNPLHYQSPPSKAAMKKLKKKERAAIKRRNALNLAAAAAVAGNGATAAVAAAADAEVPAVDAEVPAVDAVALAGQPVQGEAGDVHMTEATVRQAGTDSTSAGASGAADVVEVHRIAADTQLAAGVHHVVDVEAVATSNGLRVEDEESGESEESDNGEEVADAEDSVAGGTGTRSGEEMVANKPAQEDVGVREISDSDEDSRSDA